jgi:hypothetical protein
VNGKRHFINFMANQHNDLRKLNIEKHQSERAFKAPPDWHFLCLYVVMPLVSGKIRAMFCAEYAQNTS